MRTWYWTPHTASQPRNTSRLGHDADPKFTAGQPEKDIRHEQRANRDAAKGETMAVGRTRKGRGRARWGVRPNTLRSKHGGYEDDGREGAGEQQQAAGEFGAGR